MQLFLENSIEIIGLLMQKITNSIICVLYNCNFLISVNYCMLYDTVNFPYTLN